MDLADRIAELVEYLVLALVDNADEVSLVIDERDSVIVLEVHVAPDDIGKIIGRKGRVIKSIRSLAHALATKNGADVEVEVMG